MNSSGQSGARAGSDILPPERRQLTVVFIDIVDATSLSERLDPEDFFSILGTYREVCNLSIEKYGGHLARMIGDEILAYFGVPHAHEDDPERAVHAALSIVEAIGKQDFSTVDAKSVRLDVRIAINTGLVVVGALHVGSGPRREIFGTPAHIAARLQGITPVNAIVIGPLTYELVRGAFECTCLGEQIFKGVKESTTAWRVERPLDSESRFERTRTAPLTPIMGRASELAALTGLWRKTAEGAGQIAVISGDAGIGKSRLIQTFRGSVESPPKVTLYFQCSPLQISTPLAPMIDRDRRAAGISQSDSAAAMVGKLRSFLRAAISDVDSALPYYGALLSIPACEDYAPADLRSAREHERALKTVVDATVGLSRRQPVLMIVEDAQWIDPTSIDLLGHLIHSIGTERILLIITHRSDYEPYWLIGRPVHPLPLGRLDTRECEQVVRSVAGDIQVPRGILRKIIERTDGVPLFLEEFSRAVFDDEYRSRPDNRSSRHEIEPLVPASIHDSLMERLDRLGDAKRVAQVAAIFGRQFEYEGLQHLLELSPRDLGQALKKIEDSGLVYRQRRGTHAAFLFKHAMIQEAAYTSLLKEVRSELHARAANWLRQSSPLDGPQLAILGYHYSRAGMIREAVAARLEAGKAALARSASKEAIANLWEGVELVSQLLPSQPRFEAELALQSTLAMAYTSLAGWSGPQVDEPYRRAQELCRTYGTSREKSIVLWGVTIAKLVNCELARSLGLASEFMHLSREWDDRQAAMMAHTAAVVANFFLGRLSEAHALAKLVCAQYDESTDREVVRIYQHDPKVVALVYLGHIEWLFGHGEEAKACCESAVRLARQLDHPFMLAYALILGGSYYLYEGDVEKNLSWVQEGVKIANEHALSIYGIFGPLWATPALAARNPDPATLDHLADLLSKLLDNRCYLQAPFYQILLATELGRNGQVARARALAADAQTLMERTGERWFEPEIYRVRAFLSYQAPNPDNQIATALFARSLASARDLKTVGWQLRTAISFARFLISEGKRDRAREVLLEAQGGFCSDEVTVDLAEAGRMLERLDSAG
jgi:class 3 adenylate cyclase/predicted ATPase/DNA-binding transcriptional ArsR family regulator